MCAPEEGKNKKQTVSIIQYKKWALHTKDKHNKHYGVMLVDDVNAKIGNNPFPKLIRSYGELTLT